MDGCRYLLDTDTVSQIIRKPDGSAARRLLQAGTEEVALSVIVASELRFGVAKRGSRRLAHRIEQVLERIEILPLEPPVDEHYAQIRHALERAGTPIGPNDLLIAAHARALGLVMVTGNAREFSRVPGLEVENWLE